MYDAPGVGLAAPQIGVHQRIIVIDISGQDEPPDLIVAINPVIVHADGRILRGRRLPVGSQICRQCPPACPVVVKALDLDGKKRPGRRTICWPSPFSTRSTIWTASCSSTTSRRSKRDLFQRKRAAWQKRKQEVNDDRLRIVFMGTPDFACPTLQMLIDRGEHLVAVVTQPDRPKGRGQQLMPPPVKELAHPARHPGFSAGQGARPGFYRDHPRTAAGPDRRGRLRPDSPQVPAGYPAHGLHQCPCLAAAPLPRRRAAQLVHHQRRDRDRRHHHADGCGARHRPMLLKRSTPIDEDEDIVSLHDRLSVMGAEPLAETLDVLAGRHARAGSNRTTP